MLVVTGRRTTIVTELENLLPNEEIVRLNASLDKFSPRLADVVPIDGADRYILAAGVLHSKRIDEQSEEEIKLSLAVNLISVVQICERVLSCNPRARICVLGSESGYSGSYDTTYFLAKAALHSYVEKRRLTHKDQQLIAVSPGIIENSGMTQRREDTEVLQKKQALHSKRRFLRAVEVARMIKYLLWDDSGYTTNTVVRMRGEVCGK